MFIKCSSLGVDMASMLVGQDGVLVYRRSGDESDDQLPSPRRSGPVTATAIKVSRRENSMFSRLFPLSEQGRKVVVVAMAG